MRWDKNIYIYIYIENILRIYRIEKESDRKCCWVVLSGEVLMVDTSSTWEASAHVFGPWWSTVVPSGGPFCIQVSEPAHRKILDDLIIVNHWERAPKVWVWWVKMSDLLQNEDVFQRQNWDEASRWKKHIHSAHAYHQSHTIETAEEVWNRNFTQRQTWKDKHLVYNVKKCHNHNGWCLSVIVNQMITTVNDDV